LSHYYLCGEQAGAQGESLLGLATLEAKTCLDNLPPIESPGLVTMYPPEMPTKLEALLKPVGLCALAGIGARNFTVDPDKVMTLRAVIK